MVCALAETSGGIRVVLVSEAILMSDPIDGLTSYERWRAQEGVPVVSGLAVPDLNAVEVGPWPRLGAAGAFVDLLGNEGENGAFVLDLGAGQSSLPEKNLYEEMFYVLRGAGATRVWDQRGRSEELEWGPRSLFTVPPSYSHSHRGASPGGARLLGVTDAATVMNLLHDPDFVLNCPGELAGRFADKYYPAAAERLGQRSWETTTVRDVAAFDLEVHDERGPGHNIAFEMGRNTLAAHVSSFPAGTYKKAHRHPGGAHVVIIEGSGYSLMWPEGSEPERIPWQVGSLVVPPGNWYHQHFNTGDQPARYLALRWGSKRFPYKMWLRKEYADFMGGWCPQIEYEDEDPAIRRDFEAALAAARS
jgi:oxalate decarboxylase/phosphoglucose isomerase-like protein (cupin superfamily)